MNTNKFEFSNNCSAQHFEMGLPTCYVYAAEHNQGHRYQQKRTNTISYSFIWRAQLNSSLLFLLKNLQDLLNCSLSEPTKHFKIN